MKRRALLKSTAALVGGGFAINVVNPSFSRAAETPTKGGTLIWGHSETTQNLDVQQAGAAATLRLLQNIHCSLVTIDKNFKIIPSVAESFEMSPDGLTYTFQLRKGVKFHNGATLTSADVKYSFERCKDPKTGAVNIEVFNSVSAIETPDDHTVIIKMSQIYVPFLGRIAENGAGAIIPTDSGPTQGTMPTGCGPFTFVSREFGHEVHLARFDDYWDGPAYLDKVTVREITEPTVRLTGLQTGELHMINDVPDDHITAFENNKKFQTVTWFPLNWDFVNMNHDFAPFKDKNVRLAIDLLIDKDQLLQGALWGQGKLTASPSFPTSATYDPALKNRAQNIAEARKLLAAAGYGPGQLKLVFKATTNYPYHIQAAQIMVQWFAEGGINMTIEQLTWADWLSQVWVNKDFQISMMNFFTLWEPDFLYYSLWRSTGTFNYRHINDPVIDGLVDKARVTVDPAARAELYKQVQQQIYDEVHDVILWFRNGSIGAQLTVGGLDTVVHPNGSNLNFHKVWLSA
jgi:ABC-type transport system substrate-binding protein